MSHRTVARALRGSAIAAAFLLVAAVPASAQGLEGSKWTIEQEGVDGAVLWWLGSEGRVRTGDVGTILAGYRWRMSGDSLVVTVGDSMRYAAMLMSGRLVGGVRTGPHRTEGWWSAERADAAAQVASTPTTPAGGTQPMSRPADGGVQPSTTPTTTPAPTQQGGRRPIRRIEREGETSAPPTSQPTSNPSTTATTPSTPAGEHEIRRIPRPNRPGTASAAPADAAADGADFAGRWIADDSTGTIAWMQVRPDGTFDFAMQSGSQYSGTIATAEGRRIARFTTPVGAIPFVIARDGEAVVLTGVGAAATSSRFHRFGAPTVAATTSLEPAQLIGHWVHTNPNTGITLDLRADSTFTYVRRNATTQEGRWSVDAQGLNFQVDLIGGEAKVVTASLSGAVLNLRPRGGMLNLTLNRAPSGPSREPAVRQP